MTILNIKVIPQSRENAFVEFKDEVLKVKIKGTPTKGKVNENLIAFLADCLGIAKSQIQIISGFTNPRKKIKFTGVEEAQIKNIILSLISKLQNYTS